MCTLKLLTDFHKTKNKNKKYFCKSCLQCFSSRNISTEHKEVCLSINGAQSVRLEKGITAFKNYLKQMPLPFKVYADFECNLNCVETYEGSYSKKYQDHIPFGFAYKLVCVDDRLSKPIVLYRGKKPAYKFIEAIFKEYEYCKKVAKNILTKIWSWLKKKNNFNQVTRAGFVINSFAMKKLEITVT